MAAASATLVHCKCLEKTQIFSFFGALSVGLTLSSASARRAPDMAAPTSNVRRDILVGSETLIMSDPHERVRQQSRCIKHMEYYHYPNYIATAG